MRLFLFVLISFSAGFLIHAFFFPKVFVSSSNPDVLTAVQSVIGIEEKNDFVTPVTFDKKSFNPNKVSIKNGNYITITNMSKTELMELQSNEKLLSTVRPYAESEQLKALLPNKGTFEVIENHSKAKLIVEVVD
jgi:hypothetical protein